MKGATAKKETVPFIFSLMSQCLLGLSSEAWVTERQLYDIIADLDISDYTQKLCHCSSLYNWKAITSQKRILLLVADYKPGEGPHESSKFYELL